MIVSISHDNESVLNPKDEKKLLAIENKNNIIFRSKSNYNNTGILSWPGGKILLFDDTYQGGQISYNGYTGGLPYTRYFQLAAVINNNIKNILILGLGSGSVVIDSLKIYNINRIDAIDIDSEVIEIAQKYFNLPEDERLTIHCVDALEFINNNNFKYDFIIVDLFLSGGLPIQFMTDAFIENLHQSLTPDGIAAINLFASEDLSGDISEIFKIEYKIYQSFFSNIYVFPVLYGAFEFFRYCCDLRYQMSPLTNIMLLATNNPLKLNKQAFIEKSKLLHSTTNLSYIKYLPLYARDYYDQSIQTDNLTALNENFVKALYAS